MAARRLRDLIRSEVLRYGRTDTRLSSEAELAVTYGVSRNTVRDALRLLQVEGIIERVQGAGTFMTAQKYVSSMSAAKSFERVHGAHHEVLELCEVEAAAVVSSVLQLDEGAHVILLERRTIMAGVPIGVWTSYLPLDVGTKLRGEDLRLAGDYYETLEFVLGESVKGARMVVEATTSENELTALLGVDVGAPVLRFERTVFTASGRPVDFGFGLLDANKVSLLNWQSRSPAGMGPASPR